MGCLPSKTPKKIVSFKPEFKICLYKQTIEDEIQEINEVFSLSLEVENSLIEFKNNETIGKDFGSKIEVEIGKGCTGEVKSMVLKFKE